MASFTVTTNATASGQQLAAAASCVISRGTTGGAALQTEISSDNSNWAPLFLISSPGSWIVAIPSQWYVRVTSTGAGSNGTTNCVIEVA